MVGETSTKNPAIVVRAGVPLSSNVAHTRTVGLDLLNWNQSNAAKEFGGNMPILPI